MTKSKLLAYGELFLLALLIVLILWWTYPKTKTTDELGTETATTTRIAFFPDVTLEARAAYIYDASEDKVLFEKDAELQWPLASLTKLMSVFVASTIIPEHVLVKINSNDLRQEGDTGLYPDEQWNLRKLTDYILLVSSNDGVSALAALAGAELTTGTSSSPEPLFIDAMNQKAKELGLKQTYFLNQSGLDVTPALSGGYGSAKDVALLVNHILKTDPHLLEATTFEKLSIDSKNFIHDAVNTNKVIGSIPNVLGSKTGYTDLSGGNVVVALNAGIDRPIIISVLGSSYDGRFTDLSKLVDATIAYLSNASTTFSMTGR